MEDIIEAFIPLIGISMPIAIVWIALHYRYKSRALGEMTGDQIAELERMSKVADILDRRVAVLESILDDEIPTWRERHDKTI